VPTILCFGDSNTWGCIPIDSDAPGRRHPPDVRWTGVLRRELGDGWWVAEEGLNGRTTVFDDPLEPYRNGRELLPPALVTHHPVDVVVLMLGTNDLKHRFDAEPHEIAAGAGALLEIVRTSAAGPDQRAPRSLLVCPAPVGRLERFAADFVGATEKSRELASHYAQVAAAHGAAFLDAGQHIRSSDVDGIHLDAEAHEALGRAIAAAVQAMWISTSSATPPSTV